MAHWRQGAQNALAARLRIMERALGTRQVQISGDLCTHILTAARRVHEILDGRMACHSHTLQAGIRQAARRGLIPDHLTKRLMRIAKSANIVRHTTEFSIELALSDLSDILSDNTPKVVWADLSRDDSDDDDNTDGHSDNFDEGKWDWMDDLFEILGKHETGNTGRVVLLSAGSYVAEFHGQSLLQGALARRDAAREMVHAARTADAEALIEPTTTETTSVHEGVETDVTKFMPGDKVYMDGKLYTVMLVGWGRYHGKVRVRLPQVPWSWEAGTWVAAGPVRRMMPGMRLRVMQPIESAEKCSTILPAGIDLLYEGLDTDGDIYVEYDGHRRVVFWDDAQFLRVEPALEP